MATTPTTEKSEKIDSALLALNETAKKSSQQIKSIIEEDYEKIRKLIAETSPEAKKALEKMKTDSIESVKQTADSINENVHKNPWMFIGGAAAITGLVGYILGRNSKRN